MSRTKPRRNLPRRIDIRIICNVFDVPGSEVNPNDLRSLLDHGEQLSQTFEQMLILLLLVAYCLCPSLSSNRRDEHRYAGTVAISTGSAPVGVPPAYQTNKDEIA
ncbi:hypothetical protein GYMLUDRAFT_250817 [Collybiopsis luxurians FD-317 M1]|uniref:Uncharacterized protein n=1 Tax=Collybiopsis luxurians FD-317 M1 TaxID=944289 RepID=A0A0D0AR35_9AGAR|nr:hypothetical protein GYMLUDRAFT_250817 [Collybiopsis luxurians FD-317 M1]